MRRMMTLPAVLAACIPAPHPLVGAACDGPDPCPGSLVCQANHCADGPLDAGALNLVQNGSFEDGSGNGWNPLSGNSQVDDASDPIRSGVKSAKVSAVGTGSTEFGLVFKGSVPLPAKNMTTYCGRAWVARGTNVNPIVFTWAANVMNMKDISDGGPPQFPPTDGGWFPITNSFVVQPNVIGLMPRIVSHLDGADGFFFVDDVAVWMSEDGGCLDGP